LTPAKIEKDQWRLFCRAARQSTQGTDTRMVSCRFLRLPEREFKKLDQPTVNAEETASGLPWAHQ